MTGMTQSIRTPRWHPRSRSTQLRDVIVRLGACMLSAWLCSACVDTPLDATLLEAEADTGSVMVPSCTTVNPRVGRTYTIISKPTGYCLTAGELTTIEPSATGATGFTVKLVTCADTINQHWELIGDSLGWQVQNIGMGLNLDLEGGSVVSGTEALLFSPHGGKNQIFQFIPQGDDSVEISPPEADNGCLQAMATGENAVELQGCPNTLAVTIPSQTWFLSEVGCDEQ